MSVQYCRVQEVVLAVGVEPMILWMASQLGNLFLARKVAVEAVAHPLRINLCTPMSDLEHGWRPYLRANPPRHLPLFSPPYFGLDADLAVSVGLLSLR